MTDARLPERWLNDRRLTRLSDTAWRLYSFALMYAVANRTEGMLSEDDLGDVPRVDPKWAVELERAGLWERQTAGWLIVDFADTQTSNAQLEANARTRILTRERVARKRARDRAESTEAGPADVTLLRVTDRVTSLGQDRPGQDRTGTDVEGSQEQPFSNGWQDVAVAVPGVSRDHSRDWDLKLYDRER